MVDHGKDARTLRKLEEVIQLTEQQYEDYQNGGLKITRGSGKEDISIRDTAHRILDATLSFKDIISAIAAFDPTNHASSAWAIVSLGLTMTKNHMDIRDALFKSSEFLADVLARCAFIEKTHYCNNQSETKDKIEKALVKVYTTNLGKRMLESVPAVSNHPIIQIESSIKNDEQALHHWVQRNEHLQHQKSAEDMLDQIDEVITSIQHLHQKLDHSNLRNAEGASFDSYENQHDAECLPGTREEILQQIKQWGSSVQGQLARMLKEQGQLGASFFFKRGEGDRSNAKRLFSTITRQLVTAIPHLTRGVSNAIDDDPDISTKSLKEQFNKLLFQPFSGLNQSQHTTNMLIVIDALDECDREEDIQVLLELLPQLQKLTSVHWKIFLTSRPELSIHQSLKGMKDSEHRDFILHEIPESMIEQDISTFLKHKLSEIRVKREQNLEWPGEITTQNLVKISVPLFIFAATICRQLEDPQWDPKETLIEILTYQNGNDLEGTYMPVLDRLFIKQSEHKKKRLVEEFQKVVGAIILFKTPLSIASISRLTGVRKNLIELRLNSLHSVLSVPDDSTKPVRLFHLSFRDFLLDANIREKTECWVDEKKKHSEITLQCLKVMREDLRKNLCKLEHDGTQRIEIDQCLIDESIPPELQYSCRYWVQHLEQCKDPVERMDDVFSFLQEHFLYWMEALSILGLASELVGMIDTTRQLIPVSNHRIVFDFEYSMRC
ncbi:uncharacterized protein EURHEDRAFT_407039 [Aspergillus ruber CBS 135680]|uniref:Nephrocystin 3-like N-terminal domain-containing protein n=1 Tax=Aspergillus ruber (strain CBS 135680) TaxID=1388766 RepID=A0A017S0B7_ASPRC|nr:uncharacterized protein EURHEDRAFT_407039 [Aspergillus ruber CBS 135680]EYE90296.1 hypothetical protein EURHEDRAFT_407039 [Aspergillus ruber CBS 135680]